MALAELSYQFERGGCVEAASPTVERPTVPSSTREPGWPWPPRRVRDSSPPRCWTRSTVARRSPRLPGASARLWRRRPGRWPLRRRSRQLSSVGVWSSVFAIECSGLPAASRWTGWLVWPGLLRQPGRRRTAPGLSERRLPRVRPVPRRSVRARRVRATVACRVSWPGDRRPASRPALVRRFGAAAATPMVW